MQCGVEGSTYLAWQTVLQHKGDSNKTCHDRAVRQELTYGQELLDRAATSSRGGASGAECQVGDGGGAGGRRHGGLMAAVQQVPYLQHTISPCGIYHTCSQCMYLMTCAELNRDALTKREAP